MNYYQLEQIHGAVAEEYLDYKNIDKDKALVVCQKIESVIRNNYTLFTSSLCHSTCHWKD
jgi:hypothetical protein